MAYSAYVRIKITAAAKAGDGKAWKSNSEDFGPQHLSTFDLSITRTLLVTKGIATRSKDATRSPGRTTRSILTSNIC